jgi:hypothetical protein
MRCLAVSAPPPNNAVSCEKLFYQGPCLEPGQGKRQVEDFAVVLLTRV